MMRPIRPALSLAALLALSCSTYGEADAAPEKGAPAAVLTNLVALTLERHHYTGQGIDDARSRQWLEGYIENLDPARMFFLGSDVAGFRARWATALDDTIEQMPADLEPAFEIDKVFRTRVAERMKTIEAVLGRPQPLDGQDTVRWDREDLPWPATRAEADGLWERRLKGELMRYRLTDMEEPEARERLLKRYTRFAGDLEQEDSGDLLEAWLGALGQTFDPHSIWFKPARKDDFDIEMRDSLEGIGATLSPDGPYTVVRSLVPGGPAFKGEQLKPGDKIIGVTQQNGDHTDIIDMRLDRVVKLIRGPKGTRVVLTVIPADATDSTVTRDITILRDKVKVAEAEAKGEVKEVDGHRIGVIDVPSFYQDVRGQGSRAAAINSTAGDMEEILRGFAREKVDVVLVDLRANGGGSLQQAIEVTGLFIDQGPVVQIRDREGKVEILDDEIAGRAWSGPLVVLQSIYSASASEIFAGAVQDYGRGLVVGAQATHGKGTVQQLVDMSPMLGGVAGSSAADQAGALKFTTDQFYRVSGKSTQNRGVLSDVVIPTASDGLDVREGDLDNALPYHEIRPARFRSGGLDVDLGDLQDRSQARVASSEDFQKMAALRAEREKREGQPVSLNLDTRRAELAEFEKLEQAADPGATQADTEVPTEGTAEAPARKDPVLKEALAISVDFVRSRGR
ncbi:MAG: carboxy terminal-processing peptidase [Myxococcota bacterium]|nr:carboxy terminal-processing peptidase [Myxococcota bacterium]